MCRSQHNFLREGLGCQGEQDQKLGVAPVPGVLFALVPRERALLAVAGSLTSDSTLVAWWALGVKTVSHVKKYCSYMNKLFNVGRICT